MSFFEKSKIDLKKYYIIHSSASACATFATLPLCSCFDVTAWSRADHYAVETQGRKKVRIKGPTDGEVIFANSWMWIFGGCFEFIGFSRFLINIIKTYIKI